MLMQETVLLYGALKQCITLQTLDYLPLYIYRKARGLSKPNSSPEYDVQSQH